MTVRTRAQLTTENNVLFTANGTGAITGPLVNVFQQDMIDSALLIDDLTDSINVTVGALQEYATINDALAAAGEAALYPNGEINVLPTGDIVTSIGDIANINGSIANKVSIIGPAPIVKTLTGVTSFSGVAGAYPITYPLADTSNISVGDWGKVDNVRGSNWMEWGLNNPAIINGKNLGAIDISGVNWTLDFSATGILAVGNLIAVPGELLEIATIAGGGLTGTFVAAAKIARSDFAYWFVLKKLTGTITSSGGVLSSTIVGVGTTLLADAEIGSILFVNGQTRIVSTVPNDLGMTLTQPIIIAGASAFAILPAIYNHVGGFKITAVNPGVSVTLLNTNPHSSAFAPPALKGLTSATLTVTKCTLKQDGAGNGIVVEDNGVLKYVDNVAIIGTFTTGLTPVLGSVGVNCGGTPGDLSGSVTFGSNVIISGWGTGIGLYGGIRAEAEGIAISTCAWAVADYDSSFINLDNAVISNCTQYGVLASSNAGSTLGGTVFAGIGLSATYSGTASSHHSDMMLTMHCGTSESASVLFGENGGALHMCPALHFGGLGNHHSLSYMTLRISGTMSASPAGFNAILSYCIADLATVNFTGAGITGGQSRFGLFGTSSHIVASLSGFAGASGHNVLSSGSKIDITSSVVRDSTTANGAFQLNNGRINATGAWIGNNFSSDYRTFGYGATLDASSAANGAATYGQTVDVLANNFSLISSGAVINSTFAAYGLSATANTGLAITAGAIAGIDASASVKGVSQLADTAAFLVGTSAVRTNTPATYWGAQVLVALTDAATVAVDMSLGTNFSLTIGGNRTLGNPTNVKIGSVGRIAVTQDGTGTRTLGYAANWDFAGGVAPVLSVGAGQIDILRYFARTATSLVIALESANIS